MLPRRNPTVDSHSPHQAGHTTVADSTPTTAAGWTRNAIQEINSGEVADARQMLAAALRLDPDYETAWIWFGSIATDDAERRYCYERALAIDPDSVVATQLAQIKSTESRPPVELHDLEAPPLPDSAARTTWSQPRNAQSGRSPSLRPSSWSHCSPDSGFSGPARARRAPQFTSHSYAGSAVPA